MKKIIYHVGARLDVLEIVEWYERQDGPELADRFTRELEEYVEKLANSPLRYKDQKAIRRANLDRFPYHFLYRFIDEETIKILTVKHDRRRTSYGRRRR
ncbi:MAG: type II toxin-antitoxin system RelE/ParE family toxin [Acidobacteria bacterium]|nr:type II toxin-antitoxin system RelE/ParE family toxin [Acidobacteriota bacterium]